MEKVAEGKGGDRRSGEEAHMFLAVYQAAVSAGRLRVSPLGGQEDGDGYPGVDR